MNTDRSKNDDRITGQDHDVDREKIRPQPVTAADKDHQPGGETDRPGFDLGGAKSDGEAGRGLGLGADAKDGREEQRLPRGGRGDQTSGS